MLIWLVTPGEPLPIDSNHPRLMRTGILANLLADNGHKVVWWSTTFNHSIKQFRFNENTRVTVKQNLTLVLLHGKGYKHNLSIDRIVDHKQVANNFTKLSLVEQKPDIIVSSFPTPDLALASVNYGAKHDVPVLIDIRDLWPEVFIDVAPRAFKKIAAFALLPLFNQVKHIFKQAHGLIGLTEAFLEIGLQKNKISKRQSDAVFPLGYKNLKLSESDILIEINNWKHKGINCTDKFTICFFGSIGHHSDLETVIETAKLLEISYPSVQFVFCGTGDTFEKFKQLSSKLSNIHYPGYVGRKEIVSLMKVSKLGIIPYKSTLNYQNNITNKAIEYLSEGLPILTGLTGYFRHFIQENEIGFVYENGNPHALFDTIKHLFDNQNLLNAMSKNAFSLYEQAFEADDVYTRHMNHLENVVENYKNTVHASRLHPCN